MSALNSTLWRAGGAISGDTMVSSHGLPGAPRVLGHTAKVFCFPNGRFIGGAIGCRSTLNGWQQDLGEAEPSTLAAAVERTAALLPRLWATGPRCGGVFLARLLGWSETEGRVLGWLFSDSDGWKPQPHDHSHWLHPHPQVEDRGEARRLRRLADAALDGREVEGFHVAVARCQAAACRAGRYFDGSAVGIGGFLWFAEVGEHGATCREICAL